MYNNQNGVCAICSNHSQRLKLSIDHCHKNNTIRGLLCERCNSILGRVKDNISILENAIIYLKKSNGVTL